MHGCQRLVLLFRLVKILKQNFEKLKSNLILWYFFNIVNLDIINFFFFML